MTQVVRSRAKCWVMPVSDVLRVTFLVHSLRIGGAEVQLSALARGMDRSEFMPTVVSFHDDGELLEELRDAGITVVTLGLRGHRDLLGLLLRAGRALRDSRPDVVYSFLDFPNAVAAVLKPWMRGSRLVWGIRASDMQLQDRDRTWRTIFALERLLAGAANLIICNSWAGRDHLARSRFPTGAMTVVGNGIDTARYCPDPGARKRWRAKLGVSDGDMVIGLIARLDPMKDHKTFLNAAADLARDRKDARFVCVGGGADQYVRELRDLGQALGLTDRLIWTGARGEVSELLNAFDIATLSSAYGEGFPNAVGESMATALPFVATDVGDVARIIGEAGTVVPTASPLLLAAAWRDMVRLSPEARGEIGAAARARIVACFPRKTMIEETSEQLRHICSNNARRVALRESG
jgi:glycosyltransferase involved in cell wall biosynthesis